jgi:hypothetical protein
VFLCLFVIYIDLKKRGQRCLIYRRSFVAGMVALSLLTSFSCIISAVITAVHNYPAESPATIHTPGYELVVIGVLRSIV